MNRLHCVPSLCIVSGQVQLLAPSLSLSSLLRQKFQVSGQSFTQHGHILELTISILAWCCQSANTINISAISAIIIFHQTCSSLILLLLSFSRLMLLPKLPASHYPAPSPSQPSSTLPIYWNTKWTKIESGTFSYHKCPDSVVYIDLILLLMMTWLLPTCG